MKNKLSLSTVKWKEFKIKDLFKVTNLSAHHKENLKNDKKGISYITRTSLNNGLEDVVKKMDFFKVNQGNCITLGAENADFFYQPNEFITGNKMYKITNKNINRYNGLFLVQIFRQSIKNAGFGYGKGLTGTRFKERFVMLPIDKKGQPYWQFMENYIKQEQKEIALKIVTYYENEIKKLGFGILGFKDVEWRDFEISELFLTFNGTNGLQTPTGSYIPKSNLIESKIPRITAKDTDNGIDGYFESNHKNFRTFENFLSVSFMGSVFYHPYKASLDMKVHALIPKDFELNENLSLFFAHALKNNFKLFSYGNQLSSTDLAHQRVLLPIDEKGQPHYEYMNKFIEKMKKDNIERVLEYIYIYI